MLPSRERWSSALPLRRLGGACSAAHIMASASFFGPGTIRLSTKLNGAFEFLHKFEFSLLGEEFQS